MYNYNLFFKINFRSFAKNKIILACEESFLKEQFSMVLD
jgi:hypothetical protein